MMKLVIRLQPNLGHIQLMELEKTHKKLLMEIKKFLP